MKRKHEEVEESVVAEETIEVDGKEVRRAKREERLAKKKKAKQKERQARFAGLILLFVVLFVGFCLYVLGEIRSEDGRATSRYPDPTPVGRSLSPSVEQGTIRIR
jgi:uncharacterized protein HemX